MEQLKILDAVNDVCQMDLQKFVFWKGIEQTIIEVVDLQLKCNTTTAVQQNI